MIVVPFVLGPFQENCYVVTDPGSGATAIVDPGADGDRLVAEIERLEHHIGAIATAKRRWDVPVYLHPLDQALYRVGGRQAQLYGIPYEEPPSPDREFAEGEKITLGALELDVIHVPGHAPGHVVIYGHGNALVGDCLFAGSIGRTDLPFSNPSQLEASLKRIASL